MWESTESLATLGRDRRCSFWVQESQLPSTTCDHCVISLSANTVTTILLLYLGPDHQQSSQQPIMQNGVAIATKWLLPPDRWHEEPQTDYWHRLHILTTKCYHWPAGDIPPAGYDRQALESTQKQSSNLCIPDWLINNWFPEGTVKSN